MKHICNNSAGESSGMLLWLMLNSLEIRKEDVIVMFGNTGNEHEKSLVYLHDQELYYGFQFVWVEYEFPEGFEELLVKEPTYQSLQQCVDEGTGFAGMYDTDLLDSIRWDEEYKTGMKPVMPKKVKKLEKQGQCFFQFEDFWELEEIRRDFTRMFKDFYGLFGQKRGSLWESRFKKVDFGTADRRGIPLLKTLLYKNAIRYAKGLPFVVPNPAHRFSTGDLKIKPMDDYLSSLGMKQGVDYYKYLGMRADEQSRYWANQAKDGSVLMPLYEMGIDKQRVKEFWDSMPFELGIRNEKYLGNCLHCYLKSKLRLIKSCQNSSVQFERNAIIEAAANDHFRRDFPISEILKEARERTITEEDLQNDPEPQMSCGC